MNSDNKSSDTTIGNVSKEPSVTKDPRFQAGRALVQSGKVDEGGIEMFATLLEATQSKYGDTSIETAACFYEYGNALFRSANRRRALEEEDDNDEKQDAHRNSAAIGAANEPKDGEKKLPAKAEDSSGQDEANLAPQFKKDEDTSLQSSLSKEETKEIPKSETTSKNDSPVDDDDENDATLALEMMENAFSIYDLYINDGEKSNKDYTDWVSRQLPRVLTGIGDVFMFQKKNGDAVDAFTRAIQYREQQLEKFQNEKKNPQSAASLEELTCRRLLTESFVLVCEALLDCPINEDVKTTETCDILVKANEKIDYIKGYYDKARDELQEAVFLMGKIAASGTDLKSEKEDLCFLSTMLMAVGQNLAALEEESQVSDQVRPTKKVKT